MRYQPHESHEPRWSFPKPAICCFLPVALFSSEKCGARIASERLTHAFGEKSNNVDQFHHAKWAGEHHVNMSEGEIQQNFGERIKAISATLNPNIANSSSLHRKCA